MTSENRQTPVCDIRFGVSGLRNPSLQDNFYPSDLPEDWLLDYYSNEFRLVLLSPADPGILSSENTISKEKVSQEIFAEAIAELCEDIEGEDFVVFLDVSDFSFQDLSEDSLKKILNSRCNDESSFFLINLNALLKTKHTNISHLSIPFSCKKCQGENGSCLFCYISEQQTIPPPELKKIIEQIREQAKVEQVDHVSVIFSSPDNALENCRNANLLESMM